MTASGAQINPSGWPIDLQAASIAAPDLLDMAGLCVSTEELGQAILACLAGNRQLRHNLLEGLCLFQLAAFRAQGREPSEEKAQDIVALLGQQIAETVRQASSPCSDKIIIATHMP